MTPVPDIRDHIATTTTALLNAANEAGMALSGDLRVSEVDAARLLGFARSSLKQLRDEGTGPRAYRVAIKGQRISYRLSDLATWIEERRE